MYFNTDLIGVHTILSICHLVDCFESISCSCRYPFDILCAINNYAYILMIIYCFLERISRATLPERALEAIIFFGSIWLLDKFQNYTFDCILWFLKPTQLYMPENTRTLSNSDLATICDWWEIMILNGGDPLWSLK